MQSLVAAFANEPEKLSAIRHEFETLAAPYYHGNVMHQEYLVVP